MFFRSFNRAQTIAQPSPSVIPAETNVTFDRLDPDLLSALLEAQFAHAQATLFLNNEATPFSSTLLGFDYYENTVLIDGLSPPIDRKLRKKLESEPFWMQIKHHNGYLNISCILLSVQHDLYTLQLLGGELTHNRRWNSRLVFQSRQGPKIRVTLRQALPMEGTIRDLSVAGASIDFFGKDVRPDILRDKEYPCHIHFNDHFRIATHMYIKQSRFVRQPCCHSNVRVIFAQQDDVLHAQLRDFIESMLDTAAA